jgi:hypothetical protein
MLVSISNQAKLVAFVNYRRLEIKRKQLKAVQALRASLSVMKGSEVFP